MSDPVVGPGPYSRSELRAWADAKLKEQAEEAANAPSPAERRRMAATAQAEVMRRRRADPKIRAKENLSFKARDTAYRRLAAAFPDDFLRILNDERIKQGLPLLVRRKQRTATVTTLPHKEAQQPEEKPAVAEPRFVERKQGVDPKTCKHSDYPLKKFSYGKFCGNCGTMIR